MPPRWILLPLWAGLIALYFWSKAPITLAADWTHDDLMNGYRALASSYADNCRDLVFFWRPTPYFRPLGQLFYKVLYDNFGMAQLPQRLAVTALLLGNAFLLGHLAYRISRNFAYGLAAMAIAAYHPMWLHLYTNTGTVYEILAFTLVYLGLWLYVELRETRWVELAVLPCFLLALNAKESGIVLAAIVVLYELVFFRRIPWRISSLFLLAGLAFILGRIYGPEGLSSVGMYEADYRAATYFARFQHYYAELLIWPQAPLWVCLLACALPAFTRTREGVFAALLFPLGILPLAFVPERGLEGVYIACAALPLGFSSVLLLAKNERQQLSAAALLLAALAIFTPHLRGVEGWQSEQKEIRVFRDELLRLAPVLPPRIQIRFLQEPFNADAPWASTFATRLLYRDTTIDVSSPQNPHTKDFPASRDFAVFTWKDGRLLRLK